MRLLPPLLFSLLLVASALPADAGTIRDATLRTPTRDPRGALAEELVRSAADLVLRSTPVALTTDAPDTDSGRIDLRAVPQDTDPAPAALPAPSRAAAAGGTLTITSGSRSLEASGLGDSLQLGPEASLQFLAPRLPDPRATTLREFYRQRDLEAAANLVDPGIVPEPHAAGLLALAALALTGLRRRR